MCHSRKTQLSNWIFLTSHRSFVHDQMHLETMFTSITVTWQCQGAFYMDMMLLGSGSGREIKLLSGCFALYQDLALHRQQVVWKPVRLKLIPKHNWPLRFLSHKTGSSCATASEDTEDFSGQPEVIQVCQRRLVILVSLRRPAHSRNIIVVLIHQCHLQI